MAITIESCKRVYIRQDMMAIRKIRFMEVATGDRPIPDKYPVCFLYRSMWDDYGFKTTFTLDVAISATDIHEIGAVKILNRDYTGPTPLPANDFTALGTKYCSLGQSYSYYRALKALPLHIRNGILRTLRDVVFDHKIRAAFEDHPGFIESLTRNGTAVRALTDAVALLSDDIASPPAAEMRIDFETQVGGDIFQIQFAFNESQYLPDRINALVGYNGTGKTQLLANLALIATLDLARRDELAAKYGRIRNSEDRRFGAVIAVSYSAFDTFVLPDSGLVTSAQGTGFASEMLTEKGNVFGYVYCGLRKRGSGQHKNNLKPSGLKNIEEITDELSDALELARSDDRVPLLREVIAIVSQEPSWGRIGGLDAFQTTNGEEWRLQFNGLSTGHKIVLNILIQILGRCEPRSLVLIDEPESHLHPSLLAVLIRGLNVALRRLDSYAIIATHSPVVLQEIPRRQVRILERYGRKTVVSLPAEETFGENIGYLTSNIFDLDSSATDYHAVLDELARSLPMYEIEEIFDDDMSAQARAYVMGLKRQIESR